MKRTIIVFVVALLCAFSAQAAELKIGLVDLNKALNESNEGKKAVKLLEDLFKEKQADIDKKMGELNKLTEDIQKQSSILNQEALKEKQDLRDKIGKDLQRTRKDAEEEIEKKRADFMDRIIKDLGAAMKKIGEDEGYALILERAESGVLYGSEKMDITDKVITRYNEASKAETKK